MATRSMTITASMLRAAEHEKFRIENDLCYGDTATAARNAARYDQVADEIEAELADEEDE